MMTSSSSKRNGKRTDKIYGTGERIQTYAKILDFCKVYREGASVIDKINLNSVQVNHCLGFLFRTGFIQIGVSLQGNLIYKTREKGRSLLEFYYNMIQECLEFHRFMTGQIREDYVSSVEHETNLKLPLAVDLACE